MNDRTSAESLICFPFDKNNNLEVTLIAFYEQVLGALPQKAEKKKRVVDTLRKRFQKQSLR